MKRAQTLLLCLALLITLPALATADMPVLNGEEIDWDEEELDAEDVCGEAARGEIPWNQTSYDDGEDEFCRMGFSTVEDPVFPAIDSQKEWECSVPNQDNVICNADREECPEGTSVAENGFTCVADEEAACEDLEEAACNLRNNCEYEEDKERYERDQQSPYEGGAGLFCDDVQGVFCDAGDELIPGESTYLRVDCCAEDHCEEDDSLRDEEYYTLAVCEREISGCYETEVMDVPGATPDAHLKPRTPASGYETTLFATQEEAGPTVHLCGEEHWEASGFSNVETYDLCTEQQYSLYNEEGEAATDNRTVTCALKEGVPRWHTLAEQLQMSPEEINAYYGNQEYTQGVYGCMGGEIIELEKKYSPPATGGGFTSQYCTANQCATRNRCVQPGAAYESVDYGWYVCSQEEENGDARWLSAATIVGQTVLEHRANSGHYKLNCGPKEVAINKPGMESTNYCTLAEYNSNGIVQNIVVGVLHNDTDSPIFNELLDEVTSMLNTEEQNRIFRGVSGMNELDIESIDSFNHAQNYSVQVGNEDFVVSVLTVDSALEQTTFQQALGWLRGLFGGVEEVDLAGSSAHALYKNTDLEVEATVDFSHEDGKGFVEIIIDDAGVRDYSHQAWREVIQR